MNQWGESNGEPVRRGVCVLCLLLGLYSRSSRSYVCFLFVLYKFATMFFVRAQAGMPPSVDLVREEVKNGHVNGNNPENDMEMGMGVGMGMRRRP